MKCLLYSIARLCWRLGLPGLGLRLAEITWRVFERDAQRAGVRRG